MARQAAWILDCLTRIAFTSGCLLIRTFVHLCGTSAARAARAQPFPNGWREGAVLAGSRRGAPATAFYSAQDDGGRSITASGDLSPAMPALGPISLARAGTAASSAHPTGRTP